MAILISGASSGIGEAITQRAASTLKSTIYTVARSGDSLEALSGKLGQKHKARVIPLTLDLGKEGADKKLSEFLKKEKGRIKYAIHCAGDLVKKPFAQLNYKHWNQMWNNNVMSAVHMLQGVRPHLDSRAHLVILTSMGGFQGSLKFPGLTAYSSSKAAVNNLVESLAPEWGKEGIHLNALALGGVQTQMLKEAFPHYNAPVTPDGMAEFILDFTLNGGRYMHGMILPVTLGNP